MINIVLCGGNGTRLWPLSRENMPKQFLKIFSDNSLYQQTLLRNREYSKRILVVSNAQQYFLALDQSEELDLNDVQLTFIAESVGKNTAASIAFGCFSLDADDICFVTPSDHIIKNDTHYEKIIETGKKAAMEGNIVVFGTPPNKPETGYGYIKTARNSQQIQKVISFQEKPDTTTALGYLKENQNPNAKESYFWNSGMFMFQVKTYLNELKKYAPEVFQTSLQAFENAKRGDFIQLKSDDMQEIPNISVDYAVMEKSDKIKVVISNIEWNDVGSFDSLDEFLEKDENNNTKNETLIVQNSKNNFVIAKHNKMIALNDIEDLIIVDTPSALLISKKGTSQQIKEMVKKIKEKTPELAQFGRTVYRPWGNFTNLYEFDSFKVKTLVVKPGKRLSLQKHMHQILRIKFFPFLYYYNPNFLTIL